MSVESDTIPFVGADALFKKDFIPPKIVQKPKIANLILGTLSDAIENNYASTTALYGLEGSGKNLIYTKTLQDLHQKIKHKKFTTVCIDLKEITTIQALIQIIQQILSKENLSFDRSTLKCNDSAYLMHIIKRIFEKIPRNYILYLKNIESGSDKLVNKITSLSKNYKNLNLLYTINSGFQRQRFEDYINLDLKIPIGLYEKHDLYQIMSDRCTMAFPFAVPKTLKEYLFDLVSELNVKVPSSYINSLKQIYITNPDKPFDSDEIIRGVYAAAPDSELNLTAFAQELQEFDILERIYLENIIAHMKHQNRVYISNEELAACFKMASEQLEERFNENYLKDTIKRFSESCLLVPSSLNQTIYFAPYQIAQIEEILSQSFGKW
jgi:Cdc6-like AAA superfamily ATPase